MATINEPRQKRMQRQAAPLPDGAKLLLLLLKHFARGEQSRAHSPSPPYSMRIDWDPDDLIFVVSVPELPGCMTHGTTYEEAAQKGAEAIAAWVEVARDFGDPLPDPIVVRHLTDDAGETERTRETA